MLRVTGSLQHLHGKLERTTTQTAVSMRAIVLPPVLVASPRRIRKPQALVPPARLERTTRGLELPPNISVSFSAQ
jgi:hypothetical protein